MKMYLRAIGLLVTLVVAAPAQSVRTTKGSVVGTWVKQHTTQEDHAYPEDSRWRLTLTFRADGRFVWHATRTRPNQNGKPAAPPPTQVDESVTGRYAIDRYLIRYQFDNPSPAALEQLPVFFAFWPNQMRGEQTFAFHGGFLILGNDGGKTWVHLKPQESQTVEQNASERLRVPRDAEPEAPER